MSEDELDALVGASTTGPTCAVRLDGLQPLFLPQALNVRGGPEPVVYDVKGFIAPRRALVLGGGLQELRELERRSARCASEAGAAVQRLSQGVGAGRRAATGRGRRLLQLAGAPAGWRLALVGG